MNSSHRHDLSSSVNSADAESHRGTPETNSTALSPEDLQPNQCRTAQVTSTSNQPPAFFLGAVPTKATSKGRATESTTASHQDPFVTINSGLVAARSSNPPKLSPVASNFTPSGLMENTGGNILSRTLTMPVHSTTSAYVCTPNSLPSASMVPETPYDQASLQGYLSSATAGTHVSLSSQASPESLRSPGSGRQPPKSGRFSSDSSISRSVMISHMDRGTPPADVESIISSTKFQSRNDLVLENLSLTGTVFVSFTDIRDAIETVTTLHRLRGDWLVQYLPLSSYGLHPREANGTTSKYESQLLVKASFSGPSMFFDLDTVSRLILDLLNNYGGIMAYDAVITVYPVVVYRAEFYDTKDAEHAIVHLNGFRIAGCTMTVHRYRGEGPLIIGEEDSVLNSRLQQMGLEGSSMAWATPEQRSPLSPPYPVPSPSLSGTLTLGLFNAEQKESLRRFTIQDPGNETLLSQYMRPYPAFALQTAPWGIFNSASYGPGAIGQERNPPLSSLTPAQQLPRTLLRPGGRHVREHSSGHHNVVDVDRIRKGADVRTTIMLRNIPNKIDQAMLKDIVDETSRGRYDFMYLRIDFANNCNVGYAFINFEDPFSIVNFVTARSGYRWNRFNSDKVAEVSYATIQGKDCLVQKFRNSSVMLEHPSFRPKIFRTGDDAMGGTEEPFPGPDNPSKMRRSVENAEHVGLFAPRAGQNFRDEQRRRRSQYDRGTRLAEIEDSYRFTHRFHGLEPGHGYHALPHAHRFRYIRQHAF